MYVLRILLFLTDRATHQHSQQLRNHNNDDHRLIIHRICQDCNRYRISRFLTILHIDYYIGVGGDLWDCVRDWAPYPDWLGHYLSICPGF